MLQELSEDLLLTLERKDLEQADLCELFNRERLSPGPRREADRRSTKSPTCEAFIRLSEARGVISQITLMNGEKIFVHDDFEDDVIADERRDEPAPGVPHVTEATSPDESVLISNTTCSEMMNMHKLLHDSSSEPEVARESFLLVTNAATSKSLPCNSLLRSALTGKAPLNNNNNNNVVFGQKEPYRSEEKKVDEILLLTTSETSKDTLDRIKEEVCESASKYVITTAEGPVVHMESVEIAIDHNANRRRYIRRPRGGSGSSDETSAKKEARMLHHCHICNKGFKDRYSVNVHIRTHTGEKPFACSLCGKCFRQKAHLAKHHQTHAAKQALMDQQTTVVQPKGEADNNNAS